jgi:hypothetical protein
MRKAASHYLTERSKMEEEKKRSLFSLSLYEGKYVFIIYLKFKILLQAQRSIDCLYAFRFE